MHSCPKMCVLSNSKLTVGYCLVIGLILAVNEAHAMDLDLGLGNVTSQLLPQLQSQSAVVLEQIKQESSHLVDQIQGVINPSSQIESNNDTNPMANGTNSSYLSPIGLFGSNGSNGHGLNATRGGSTTPAPHWYSPLANLLRGRRQADFNQQNSVENTIAMMMANNTASGIVNNKTQDENITIVLKDGLVLGNNTDSRSNHSLADEDLIATSTMKPMLSSNTDFSQYPDLPRLLNWISQWLQAVQTPANWLKRTRRAVAELVPGYFDLLYAFDTDQCYERLMCEIGANNTDFGDLGTKINQFMSTFNFTGYNNNSAAIVYKSSFELGARFGLYICDKDEGNTCNRNLTQLVKTITVINQ